MAGQNPIEKFFETRREWLTQKALLPTITGQDNITDAKKQILALRGLMNLDAGHILLNYEQDTTTILVDSVLHWLTLSQTYQTDLRLAKHYFFTAHYEQFDAIWSNLKAGAELSEEQTQELLRLDNIFMLLRASSNDGFSLNNLPKNVIEGLKSNFSTCDEATYLSEIILRRNKIEMTSTCDAVDTRRATYQDTKRKESAVFVGFPNPANEYFNLSLDANKPCTVNIFDQYGRMILNDTFDTQNISINTSGFNNGVYFVKLTFSGVCTPSLKLVVLH